MRPLKLSIITPSYNQLQTLRLTARSVLEQAGPFDLEWVVVEDGSTDGSLEYLRSLQDPRLRVLSQANRGQVAALNRALGEVSGEVIGWINGDDLFAEGAFAAVAAAFAAHPAAGWLVGRCTLMDARGRPARRLVSAYKQYGLSRYSHRRLLRENFISQPAVFWRRAIAERVGLHFDATLRYAFDYEFWLRLARQGDPILLERVLAHFRVHPGSKSGRLDRRQFDEQYAAACRDPAAGPLTRLVHRFHVEKIVWSYRMMKRLGIGG